MDLYRYSINVILSNQHAGGAYVASPAFPTYHYCWLRDGSFTAYAMDRVGETQSAERFYRWVGQVISRYADKVDRLEAKRTKGEIPGEDAILNTRFTLEGFEDHTDKEWGNFQVDGYGSWLWGLAEHFKITGDRRLVADLAGPILTTLRYIELAWQQPNYDCWEEHPEYLHPYSLSCLYGGLAAAAELQKAAGLDFGKVDPTILAGRIKGFLLDHAVVDGRFAKHLQPAAEGKPVTPVKTSGVDASLLGLVLPNAVFDLHDPLVVKTVESIERDLHLPGGGVYRYKEDVYYGGGEWIILAAWLGWYYALAGEKDRARQLLSWIESSADSGGNLTEQVSAHLLAPKQFDPWLKKWGPVANPLLWSHAMYLLLAKTLE